VRTIAWVCAAAAGIVSCSLALDFDALGRGDGGGSLADGGTTDGAPGDASVDGGLAPERYPAAVLYDGPVAYWRLGERPGAPAVEDATGHAHRGAYSATGVTLGVPGAIEGDGDGALLLDGTSGSVAFGDLFDFPASSPFSLEAWVKPDVRDAEYRRIFSKEASDPRGRQGYSVKIQATYGLQADRVADDVVTLLRDDTVGTAAYHHVVTTFDGQTLTLYVDGRLSDQKPSAYPLPDVSVAFVVGKASNGSHSYFGGSLDELAVYDRALPAARVAAHFAAARP
jgi:hypothetical protein